MNPRTLRQAIESKDRIIIHHSLRRGWNADAPECATYGDLLWHPTIEAALGGGVAMTDEERGKFDAAMLMMPACRAVPHGWPSGDPYVPPPDAGCDYLFTWEWWSPAYREKHENGFGMVTLNGWFRGLPLF